MGNNPSQRFEELLGSKFRRRALLGSALTHRSFANENGLETDYERLEFLGDAVVGLVVSEWLFRSHPELPEGGLSEIKAYLVSRQVLARHAAEIGLGHVLRLGVGEERSGGRTKPSLLADALESVTGAMFLDRGLGACRDALVPLFEEALARRAELGVADTKTRLQELAQARGWQLPEYRHVGQQGPDHRKRFTVECWIEGRCRASAEGSSKKLAEQRAATGALAAVEGAADSAPD